MNDGDAFFPHPPIAIGGVGGSGTRVVAELLRRLGVRMGGYLTRAGDTLWFTLLFKRADILLASDTEFDLLVHALASALQGGAPISDGDRDRLTRLVEHPRLHHPVEQLRASLASMVVAAARPRHGGPWGWKEPNTHMVIERLWQRLPQLRYVHVVRNGLDMAYSRNQLQLELWGSHVLDSTGPATPARSLAFWCETHRRLQRIRERNRERMYWLDFEALCRNPHGEIGKLLGFLELPADPVDIDVLGIRPQPSKHSPESLHEFSPDDVAFVRSLGY